MFLSGPLPAADNVQPMFGAVRVDVEDERAILDGEGNLDIPVSDLPCRRAASPGRHVRAAPDLQPISIVQAYWQTHLPLCAAPNAIER